MINSDIQILLGDSIGLKLTSVGATTINNALKRRMRVLGLTEQSDYVKLLKITPQELNELIEEVVIPETWFFRDKVPFATLVDFVFEKWSLKEKTKILRVLSVPCSTGEEPYSICMALFQAGWPSGRLRIDAIDISSRAISRAKSAVYTKNSFRGSDLDYRDEFFIEKDKNYTLKNSVRNMVHFYHGNLLNRNLIKRLGIFDIIFCRNIFIYMDESSRELAVSTIHKILDHEGLFFTGHSEAGLFTSSGKFTPYPSPGAFAFIKKRQHIAESSLDDLILRSRNIAKRDIGNKSAHPVSDTKATGKDQQSAPRKMESADLKNAALLTEQGRLEEASKICEDHLRLYGPSTKPFYLLGWIRDIEGKPDEALQFLRKAVYLEPGHKGALKLLAEHAEKAGDLTAAQNFRRRAQRNNGGKD